jgi:general secretion pathway protein M
MNWRAIRQSTWGRRAYFAGLNLALVAIGYLLAVEPVRHILAVNAESLSERSATLARYEAVVAQEAAVQEYAKQIADGNARGELIAGESNGIVNANLQARLKNLAQQSKVTVRSIQMLPAKTVNGATLVGARIEVAGGLATVHALARALEGEPPLLFVMAATLRSQSTPWALPTQNDQDLEAQFDVYAGASFKERS